MKGNITRMKKVDYKHQLEIANKKLDAIRDYCENQIIKGSISKENARKVGNVATVIKYNFKEDAYREILFKLRENGNQ